MVSALVQSMLPAVISSSLDRPGPKKTRPGEPTRESTRESRGGAGIAIDSITIGPVILELAAAVATVTLSRPETGNRIDADMADAIGEVCRLIAEDGRLRLLVLTASGAVFSIDDAGSVNTGDERTANAGKPFEGDDASRKSGGPASAAVAGLAIPVLVALNGDATGPGL